MSMEDLLHPIEPMTWAALGAAALYGMFIVIMLVRKIAQKRMSEAAAADFLDQVRERLTEKDFDGVTALCDTPEYWSKAVPQLVVVGIANRQLGPSKLKQFLAEKFERDVLAELEYQHSWIGTLIRTGPMLGLLGTVVGMIMAFNKMAAASKETGVDPASLAENISFALFCTAAGLSIAITLGILGSWAHIRIGRLADAVQEQITEFLWDLEEVMRS